MKCTCSLSISASFMWLRDILNMSRTSGIAVVLRFFKKNKIGFLLSAFGVT